jgi:hypothetical protein
MGAGLMATVGSFMLWPVGIALGGWLLFEIAMRM